MQARTRHPAQIHLIIGKARAQAAHGERRTHNHWITELCCGIKTLIHRVGDIAASSLATTSLDDAFEQMAVLAELNRLEAGTDERAAVLLQDACLVKGYGRVERRLSSKGRQNSVRAFLGDDRLDDLRGDRLDVGCIGELGIGHDRRGV